VSAADPFEGALRQTEELREFYDAPIERAVRKDIGHLDEMCRRLIAAAPMLFVASYGADGRGDVSPRGGQPGFVTVLDDNHLAIPDATGNRRLDTLENVVESGRAAVIFVIPGRDTTLRVSGRACVTAEPELLERLTPVGKPPAHRDRDRGAGGLRALPEGLRPLQALGPGQLARSGRTADPGRGQRRPPARPELVGRAGGAAHRGLPAAPPGLTAARPASARPTRPAGR
jgi:predicted pyridoxine 5'-phosphate oxidase superfamily flavin-nucleotide-binding protein